MTDSGQTPARRGSRELALQDERAEELTLCPSCGRRTRTVGRGVCAECWQTKTPDGESVPRPIEPRTLPLLGSLDDVPDWAWIALGFGLLAGLLRVAFALAF